MTKTKLPVSGRPAVAYDQPGYADACPQYVDQTPATLADPSGELNPRRPAPSYDGTSSSCDYSGGYVGAFGLF